MGTTKTSSGNRLFCIGTSLVFVAALRDYALGNSWYKSMELPHPIKQYLVKGPSSKIAHAPANYVGGEVINEAAPTSARSTRRL